MGAYSPAPVRHDSVVAEVMREIIEPTVAAMKAEGRPFKGVLYAGLMLTAEGPKLLEYNVRFGDPECQVLLRAPDVGPAAGADRHADDGMLKNFQLRWQRQGGADRGDGRQGLSRQLSAGHRRSGASTGRPRFPTSCCSMPAPRLGLAAPSWPMAAASSPLPRPARPSPQAQARAYDAVDLIDWPQGFCRRDIGWRAVKS